VQRKPFVQSQSTPHLSQHGGCPSTQGGTLHNITLRGADEQSKVKGVGANNSKLNPLQIQNLSIKTSLIFPSGKMDCMWFGTVFVTCFYSKMTVEVCTSR
jgi:hypothetical protein